MKCFAAVEQYQLTFCSINIERTNSTSVMNTILEKYDIIFLQDISPNNTTTLQLLTTRLPITVIQSHSNDKMAIAINHKMENLIKIIETNTLNLTEQVSQYVNDIIQIQNTRIILLSNS